MGLGRDVRIRDAVHAGALADEVVCGFAAAEIVVDENGTAALICDRQNRTVLIKVHGAQFSGRLLGTGSSAVVRKGVGGALLEVNSGERLFGTAILDIERPENWVQKINADKAAHHASIFTH